MNIARSSIKPATAILALLLIGASAPTSQAAEGISAPASALAKSLNQVVAGKKSPTGSQSLADNAAVVRVVAQFRSKNPGLRFKNMPLRRDFYRFMELELGTEVACVHALDASLLKFAHQLRECDEVGPSMLPVEHGMACQAHWDGKAPTEPRRLRK